MHLDRRLPRDLKRNKRRRQKKSKREKRPLRVVIERRELEYSLTFEPLSN